MFAAQDCCGGDASMCERCCCCCCCCCLRPPSTPAHHSAHLTLLPCSNSKIRSLVIEMEGGLEAMAALGWQQVEEEGEQVLTLAKGAATMAQVRRGGQCWCCPCKVRQRSRLESWHACVQSSLLPASLLSFATAAAVCIATASGRGVGFKVFAVASPPDLPLPPAGAPHPGGAAGVQEERSPAEARQVEREPAGQRGAGGAARADRGRQVRGIGRRAMAGCWWQKQLAAPGRSYGGRPWLPLAAPGPQRAAGMLCRVLAGSDTAPWCPASAMIAGWSAQRARR